MKVYVLESRLKGVPRDREDSFVVLGTYDSEAKAEQAADIAWDNGAWCEFIITSRELNDTNNYL